MNSRTEGFSPPGPSEVADGYCSKRDDGQHCVHWWEGDAPCCNCGDDSVSMTVPGHEGSFFLGAETPEFRKTATIRAIQMTEPFIVKTMEGDHQGRPGDWLAQGPAGELWVINEAIFAATYAPAGTREER